MTVGRPFQRGQPRPPNSGRTRGVSPQKKPRTALDHIERRRKRRYAALDALYGTDQKAALQLEAQMLRDEVELAHLQEKQAAKHAGSMSEAQVQKAARAEGPISDEEAMRCYSRMIQGDADEGRIIAARLALSERDQLPEVLRDCRALRQAVASRQFEVRAEVSAANLMRALTPPATSLTTPAPGRTTLERTSEFKHSDVGIPIGEGVRLIPATPPQLRERSDAYPDPGSLPPPIDAEPIRGYESDPWDDDRVTPVFGGGFVRR